MFCSYCGIPLRAGLKFCTACGGPTATPALNAAVAVAAPPAPEPGAGGQRAGLPSGPRQCAVCASWLPPGAAACAACGRPAAGTGVQVLERPAAITAGSGAEAAGGALRAEFARLSGAVWGLSAAFAVATAATLLPWLSSTGPSGGTAWDGNKGRFQIADWLHITLPVDAVLVLLLALLGLLIALLTPRRTERPAVPYLTAGLGALLTLAGALEFFYVRRLDESAEALGFSVAPGFGVYTLILAGMAAVVAGFLVERRVMQRLQRD